MLMGQAGMRGLPLSMSMQCLAPRHNKTFSSRSLKYNAGLYDMNVTCVEGIDAQFYLIAFFVKL